MVAREQPACRPGDPRPVCMTTAYLDLRLPDLEKNLEALTGPISAMLERVYGIRIARIEQSIQAVRLGKRQAKLLRALDGGPALRAIRRYYDRQGRLIELSNAIHPGRAIHVRHQFGTDITRQGTGDWGPGTGSAQRAAERGPDGPVIAAACSSQPQPAAVSHLIPVASTPVTCGPRS